MGVARVFVVAVVSAVLFLSGCFGGPTAEDSEFGQPPGSDSDTDGGANPTPSSSTSSKPSTPSRSIAVSWQKALDGDFRSVAVSPDGKSLAVGFTPNVEDAPGEVRGFDGSGVQTFTLMLDDDAPPDEYFAYVPRAISVSMTDSDGGAVATNNGVVHRFSSSGTELWQTVVKWDVGFEDANVAMHTSGGVFAAADTRIAFLSADGTEQWTYPAGQTVRDVVVSSDGSECLAASDDNFVYKLNCHDGNLLGEADLGEEIQRITLSKDGGHFVAVLGDEYGFSATTALYTAAGSVVSQVEGASEGTILGDGSGFVAGDSSEFQLYSAAGVKQGTAKARDYIVEVRGATDAMVVVGVANDSRLYYLTVA